MVKSKKNGCVTIDDVHSETLSLFHRLIQRLEKLTANCEDPGTINQALKTTADFLVKLNKEREQGDDGLGALLQQTLKGIEGEWGKNIKRLTKKYFLAASFSGR